DFMSDLRPRLAHPFPRDTHVVANHVPVDHRAVLYDGGTRTCGRGRPSGPSIRDKSNADGQRHAENNSEQHAHGGLPGIPASSRAENALDRDWFRCDRIEIAEIAGWPEVGETGCEFID